MSSAPATWLFHPRHAGKNKAAGDRRRSFARKRSRHRGVDRRRFPWLERRPYRRKAISRPVEITIVFCREVRRSLRGPRPPREECFLRWGLRQRFSQTLTDQLTEGNSERTGLPSRRTIQLFRQQNGGSMHTYKKSYGYANVNHAYERLKSSAWLLTPRSPHLKIHGRAHPTYDIWLLHPVPCSFVYASNLRPYAVCRTLRSLVAAATLMPYAPPHPRLLTARSACPCPQFAFGPSPA